MGGNSKLTDASQIGHWTLDNAASNGTFMKELATLQARDIEFDSLDRRIMCFPHIINICCQHVITGFTNADLAEAAAAFDPELPPTFPDQQTFEEAVGRDPVALGCNVVHVLQNSGQRCDLFDDIVRDGNEKGWFGEPGDPPVNIKLPAVQLLHDVVTRWDTVFYMVRHLCEMRPVCSYLFISSNGQLYSHNSINRPWIISLPSHATESWQSTN